MVFGGNDRKAAGVALPKPSADLAAHVTARRHEQHRVWTI